MLRGDKAGLGEPPLVVYEEGMKLTYDVRGRALRAALAVTAVAGVGCSESHAVGDASVVPTDAAQIRDAGFDAGCDLVAPQDPACCDQAGGFWESGECIVAVPGPFVPPEVV